MKSRKIRLGAAIRLSLERAGVRRRAQGLEERLQALLDRLNVGVFRSTLEGRLLEANAAYLRILGLGSLPEARRARLPDLYVDSEDRAAIMRSLTERREIRERPVRLRCLDGRVIWVALTEALAHEGNGEA